MEKAFVAPAKRHPLRDRPVRGEGIQKSSVNGKGQVHDLMQCVLLPGAS
jgi:hypothetical protein